jgi:hypothetical protein
LIEDISIFVLFALDVVTVVLTLSVLLRLFEWGKGHPLPRVQNPFFVLALLGLLAVVAFVLLTDIELVELLSILKGSVLAIVEALDVFSAILALLIVVVIFLLLRRMGPTLHSQDNGHP